jgi:transposase, IS5 family
VRNLTDFAILQEYERIKKLGDKFVVMGSRINWEGFRQKLEAIFKNNTDCGGRPNLDVIVMLKSLFIQQLYSLLPAFRSIRIRSTEWEASRLALARPRCPRQ